MINNIILLFYFSIYLIDALCLGNFILRKLTLIKFGNNVEKWIYRFAIGNVVLSLFFIYFGMFHLLYREILLIVYLIPSLWFVTNLVRKGVFFQIFFEGINRLISWMRRNWVVLIIFLYIIFPLIPILFLYPGSWDALAYHLALPKLYLREHFFPLYLWFAESAMPIGIEAIYGMGQVFNDARLSNLVNLSFIIATVVYLTYGLKYKFSQKILYLTSLLFILRPIFYTEFTFNPNVDYPLAFYGTVLAISIIKFIESKNIQIIALIGMFAFFSFLIKYTGLFLIVTAFVITSYYLWRERSIFNLKKIKIKNKFNYKKIIIVFVLVSTMIPSIFWLIRNTVYSGNPVYPYFRNYFPDYEQKLGIKEVAQVIRDENQYWVASYQKLIQHNDDSQDYSLLFERYSAFLFLGILIVGSLQNLNLTIKHLSIFSLIFFLGIKFTVGPLFRYYFPVYPIICLIYANMFFYFIERKWYISFIPVAILLGSFFAQVDTTFFRRVNVFLQAPKLDWVYSLNNDFAKKQVQRQDNWDAIIFVNKNLDPKKDTALVMFDNRIYYYDIPVVYANTLIYFSDKNPMNMEETFKFLQNQKINYIVESDNWGVPQYINKKLYDSFVKKHGKKVFQGLTTAVYKII